MKHQSVHRFLRPCLVFLMLASAQGLQADEAQPTANDPLNQALSRPIIGPDLALDEVEDYTFHRVPVLQDYASADAWQRDAAQLRQRVLDEVVFRGKASEWRDAQVQVEWLDTIEGGPGYHIRKLRYEALPGLWIPALLYEPDQFDGPIVADGKVPVVLNVNGHDSKGKATPYKQLRCINQAKRGMVALNVEWLRMGQLRDENFDHYRMNQIDLCGTSGLAPFYLAMSRALDLLLDHPHADHDRVAVAGLSGGGWQTIVISSLDTRVTLANPVAGYSSFRTRGQFRRDLGDSEQTPVDLATVVDYTHLTAMLAPRPSLLTYNAEDQCCFRADHALPPLIEAAQPIFALFGDEKAKHLRSHVNTDPGTHNFELDNRQALYGMFRDFFAPQPEEFDAVEIPSESEIKSADELMVPLPDENANFHRLAMTLSDRLPHHAAMPQEPHEAERWQNERRTKLRQIVRWEHYAVAPTAVADEKLGDLQVTHWKLKLQDLWTVPAVEFVRGEPAKTAIILADSGRSAVAQPIDALLQSGHRVVAVDPFYFGESKIKDRDFLFALLVSAVGGRPLGIQASQLGAIAAWLQTERGGNPVSLVAVGPRTSLIASVAAALQPKAIDRLVLHQPLGSLREVIERNWTVQQYPELFCFGLLEHFDMKDIAALVVPRPLEVHEASERAQIEFDSLRERYLALAGPAGPKGGLLIAAVPQQMQPTVLVAGIVAKWIRGDKLANLRRVEPMIREAAGRGAEFICTTECFLDGYAIADKTIPLDEYRALGEPIPSGDHYKRLAALADELNVHLIAGMLEADGSQRFNTAAWIGPDGQLHGKYRKQSLGHELVRNTPGAESSVFQTPHGRAGIMICADRTEPAIVSRFTAAGADFLICPSGGMFGAHRNDPIVRSRSRENEKYIVFVHPAEFLVTAPDGSIAARTIVGDRLLITPEQEGSDIDSSRIVYFNLPVPR